VALYGWLYWVYLQQNFPVFFFKISPAERTSQYRMLKNLIKDIWTRQLAESKGGLSLGSKVIFFLGLDFICCFLSSIDVKIFLPMMLALLYWFGVMVRLSRLFRNGLLG
jgi:hypothetical protein